MKNRLKKCTAILLCVLLLISILPATAAYDPHGYFNAKYLENYAAAAYGEQGLGASYTPQATTWKVWSPTATHVQVRLYATGSDEEAGAKVMGTYSMEQNRSTGVWSLTLDGNYKDVYYTYLVTVRGVTRETRDIYAKAAGVNGDRSMVVDLDATDPQGWQNDEHVLLDESTDAVIWEVHVRDFSISPTSGVSEENRGKYLAFTEENTTLDGKDGEVSTCVSYLKEMGVNTVHLLPVYDFGSVDETDPKAWIETTMEEALSEGNINGQYNPNYYRPERNWGYDPNNYNVPEGSYSSDPYDGNVRIKEFKQMIQALHEAGISVVMDVVYNHTYDCEDLKWGRVLHNNAFNDTVPGYYFRLDSPVDWLNGSGCGNVTASDKLMYQKYMIESVRYWTEEYHIDGFRFDLMACHDVGAMNAIRADLDELYGGEGKKILMYGEPWDGMGITGIADGVTPENAQYYNLNERVALFCAWMRDSIKGNTDGDTWGWIQGDTSQQEAIFGGLTANDGRLSARSQTVTYADAHDNLILWDKILKSNGSSAWETYTGAAAEKYLKQLNLAKTIVLMSQGMAFNVGGTEFARTKLGCHNSYKAGDNINAIDWTARKTNAASADYYKGLIEIRKAFSPITDPVNEYQKIKLEGSSDSCIAIRIPNETPGEWSNLILILNDVPDSATVTLPDGSWTLIANGTQAGLTSLGTCSGTYTVPGYGSAILVQGSNGSKKAAASADEQSLNGGDKIYLNLGAVDWWLNDGAVTRLHFFNNAGGADWAETSLVEGSVYSANIPDGDWSHIILVRCNPAYTGTDYWSEECKWNQTGSLELPAEGNYLISFANDSDEATWGTYTPGTEPDPDPDPENPDYYLTGSMNGWTYPDPAYKLSFAANGEYILSNVALEIDTQLQIVDSNGQWYPGGTNYQVTENGYYDVSFYPAGQHAGYHGGYFKLTKVADYEPPVTEVFYYLTGQFAGWGINDAYKLTRVGETDEYVLTGVSLSGGEGVKVTSSKGLWYPDPGGNYVVRDTGVYDVSFYPGGGQPQPEYYMGYFRLTKVGGGSDPGDHSDADDKVILHCWNWSYDTIRENLAAIKAAGYTMVQTSPAQPHSGYHTGFVPTGDWWMLYQPLGLHIAEEGESWLGSEADLKNLCEAAHELGIEVIVDVVSNHLCNGYNDIYAAGTDPYDDSQIIADDGNGKKGYQFEVQADSRVYEHNPELSINDFRTEYIFCNDTKTEATVHGNIGMPDLKTETTNVQTSVLNYLKELVDAGVDGFRFDAAKHIETPSDEAPYASEFWPTVINGAQDYAAEKYDKELWSYGEVLSTAGHDRKMNYYSEYIDMTEISYAYTITEGFGDHKGASTIASQLFKDWLGVDVEALSPTDLVLMAESHDMYAGDGFSRYGSEVINKAWAVAVARADASALYFARPKGFTQADGCIGTLGACDDYNWMDVEVAEANKFHTAFVGADEAVYAADDFVVVERYSSTDCGAVLVNAYDTIANVNIHSQYLADGKYYDQITGNEFNVSSGWITGQVGPTGIAVLRSTSVEDCDHPAEDRYEVSKEATCTEEGYIAVYCGKCGRLVEISSVTPALGHIDEDNDNRCDRCNTFLGTVTVYFVDQLDWVSKNDHFTNVNFYAFGEQGSNGTWPGEPAELVGRTTDNHGIWKVELNPEAWNTVKFVGMPGQSEEAKTVNLPFAADAEAAEKNVLVYKPTGGTVASDYGVEYECEILDDLKSVCAHTAYTVTVLESGNEGWICDCCGSLFYGNPFVDVKDTSWYHDAVLWAFYHDPQITAGSDETHFSPNADCTREQIVTFLWKAYGAPEPTITENPFEDVKEGRYYYKAVLWAVEKGITSGVDETHFGGKQSCTREQVVTFLWNAAGKPEPETTESPFTDVQEGKWYFKAVMWAVENGITSGVGEGLFGGKQTCTRAQIVMFLYKALG